MQRKRSKEASSWGAESERLSESPSVLVTSYGVLDFGLVYQEPIISGEFAFVDFHP